MCPEKPRPPERPRPRPQDAATTRAPTIPTHPSSTSASAARDEREWLPSEGPQDSRRSSASSDREPRISGRAFPLPLPRRHPREAKVHFRHRGVHSLAGPTLGPNAELRDNLTFSLEFNLAPLLASKSPLHKRHICPTNATFAPQTFEHPLPGQFFRIQIFEAIQSIQNFHQPAAEEAVLKQALLRHVYLRTRVILCPRCHI